MTDLDATPCSSARPTDNAPCDHGERLHELTHFFDAAAPTGAVSHDSVILTLKNKEF